MPQLVTVRHRRPDGRWRRLYVPVLPVVLLLSPVLVLALVGAAVAGAVFRVSPVGALRGVGRLVWALPGARFELDDGTVAVRVHVS